MSKNHSKAHASSGTAGATGLGSGLGFGSGLTSSSILSYATEPPNLSLISDANLVVIFKNLAKKDGTTKTKALEGLQQYFRSPEHQHGELDDAILQAWAKCYPRLSIDSDRRVRQLSHILQGRLSAACGKKIAIYLPQITGSWLAGLYDNDRSTARGAQESLKLVFPTPEKLQNLRKIYHRSILDYCRDAILNETPQTLSDERSVSQDDAEAKYVRVICSSILLISSLVADMDTVEFAKHQDGYEALLESKSLWKFSYHNDPSIRRSVYRLMGVCLDKTPEIIFKDLQMISSCFVSKCLSTDQSGSSADFLESLIVLTTSFPTVWTNQYHSRRSALDQLQRFLARGSQSGKAHFWHLLNRLLQQVPVIPAELEGCMDVLRTLHRGVTSKDEPRANLEAAWTSYLSTAEYLCGRLSTEDRVELHTQFVLPIVRQYIRQDSSHTQWTLPSVSWSTTILEKSIQLLGEVLQDAWPDISSLIVADMKASSPEQSKDFESSQDSIAIEGERWALVQAVAIESISDTSIFLKSAAQVIGQAMSLLKLRNGKPYAAASVIESALRHSRSLPERNKSLCGDLSAFLLHDAPGLVTSATPSSAKLVDLLLQSNTVDVFQEAWLKTLKGLVRQAPAQDEVRRKRLDQALEAILCSPGAPQATVKEDSELQDFLERRFMASINDGPLVAGESLIQQLIRRKSAVLSDNSMDKILTSLMQSLSISEEAPCAIKGLEVIQNSDHEILGKFVATPTGSGLASNLLLLSESADEELATEASNLSASLITTVGPGSQSIVFNVISKGLSESSLNSVSVENLVGLAQRLWNETEEGQLQVAARLVPNSSALGNALAPLFKTGPSRDLSITSLLGGAVYLTDVTAPDRNPQEWDAEGFSSFLRLTLYLNQLLSTTNIIDYLDQNYRENVFRFLVLATQLINEDVTLGSARGLFAPNIEADISEFIFEIQHLINGWLRESKGWWQSSKEQTECSWIKGAIETLFESATGTSPSAYYHATTYSDLMRELAELHGRPTTGGRLIPDATLGTLREKEDFMQLVSLLTVMLQVPAKEDEVLKMLNGSIANLTSLDVEEEPQKALHHLVCANAIMQNANAPTERVAKQRIVFFVQRVTKWIASSHVQGSVQGESFKVLSGALWHMKDMYGSHWADILDAVIGGWRRFSSNARGWLPVLHGSLKLFGTLRLLSDQEDVNEDLLEAWKDVQPTAAVSLISVLKNLEAGGNGSRQPQRIVDELLARQISKTPLRSDEDLNELFPLVQAQSESIQKAAFAVLDVQIPAKQEQISFDAALDKKDARLPEELMSMILEAPVMKNLGELDLKVEIPPTLRAYLLSWLLVFDHFKKSSYKVKTDYSENIKEGDYLAGLLDLLSDMLGHGRGKAIDASKFDIVNYDSDLESLPERNLQWLLVHLFYLALKHVPSLVKAWWIECRSRQKVISIESWIEKYISPLIITDALESASEWANAQDASSDEQLAIKVSHRAKEVAASYVVDEQTMKMVILLPGAYPLQQVRVEGVSRVAVEEKKWRSWLTNCRGVVTFSNGSIPDGLNAWRKNVIGALKGQTECAICYSIISADKQLPSKRCSTCKNLFHSSCLFKWFKSSNASTCPLCRNPFNYG